MPCPMPDPIPEELEVAGPVDVAWRTGDGYMSLDLGPVCCTGFGYCTGAAL